MKSIKMKLNQCLVYGMALQTVETVWLSAAMSIHVKEPKLIYFNITPLKVFAGAKFSIFTKLACSVLMRIPLVSLAKIDCCEYQSHGIEQELN